MIKFDYGRIFYQHRYVKCINFCTWFWWLPKVTHCIERTRRLLSKARQKEYFLWSARLCDCLILWRSLQHAPRQTYHAGIHSHSQGLCKTWVCYLENSQVKISLDGIRIKLINYSVLMGLLRLRKKIFFRKKS